MLGSVQGIRQRSFTGGMNEREQFVRGALLGALGLVVAGLIGFGLFRMWDWALGFATGALVSLLSFRLIVLSVIRFTERPASRSRGQWIWWARSLLRLLGVAIMLLLVILYLPVNLVGVALGLLAVQLGMGGYLVVRSSFSQSSNAGTEDRKL
ncbi:ATP synthase subunit I [Candidatus Methylomirabilis sp.]|uniref:ATP synthase subunit I n=1 Tax=Candidatus Methylomirabilis sp. TaxID=2032687 RepID=UPI003C76B0A8